MSPRTPSLVLFDLDGVLVSYDRQARVAHLATACGVDPATVWSCVFESGLEDRFDAGLVDAGGYLAALSDALGTRVSRDAWAAARGAAMQVATRTVELVERVARERDVAILTNNGELLVDVLPELLPRLVAPFAGRVLCSARFRRRKPDPRVYRSAVALLGHEPSATLFLDDSMANIDGARSAGLDAAHVRQPAELGDVLAAYGLA